MGGLPQRGGCMNPLYRTTGLPAVGWGCAAFQSFKDRMPFSGSIRVILGENVLLGRPEEKQEIRQALKQPYRLLHVVLSFHPNLRIQLFHGILSGFRAVAISANFEHGACVALNI